jgi:hypothetical protein
MNWFYEVAGQQQGPVTEVDLDRLLAEGRITAATLVWREGMTDWQPLGTARPTHDPNAVRCASCGQFFPPAEVVQIGERSICVGCKPAVLQSLQQSGSLETLGEGGRTGPAWEHRAELGVAQAAWQTIQDVLLKPVETFTNMKREGGLANPLLYAMMLGCIGGVVSVIYQVGWNMTIGGTMKPTPVPGQPDFTKFFTATQTPLMIVVMLIVLPITVTVATFMYSGIIHLCLMLCGGANRPFETTYRVYCYAYGSTAALQAIPLCGGAVAGIWSLVATIIGLGKAHETDTWRALLAVLLPLVVCCTALIAVMVAAFGMASRH